MGVYDRLISTATRMINQKGQSAIWRSIVNDTPVNPDKPWEVSTVTTDNPVKIVFLPIEEIGRYFTNYRKNTEVPTGNLAGYMAQVSFTPTLKDVVIRDGNELTIVNLTEYNPNGESILWIVEFKK